MFLLQILPFLGAGIGVFCSCSFGTVTKIYLYTNLGEGVVFVSLVLLYGLLMTIEWCFDQIS